MSKLLQHLIFAAVFFLQLLLPNQVYGQCEFYGVVKQNPSQFCEGLYIESSDLSGGILGLKIQSGGDSLFVGDHILFSYELAGNSGCPDYPSADITCTFHLGYAGFSYFHECEEVTFVPNITLPGFTFEWFFTDGLPQSSDETTPIVNFPEHGVYEVCMAAISPDGIVETFCEDVFFFCIDDPNCNYDLNVDFNPAFTEFTASVYDVTDPDPPSELIEIVWFENGQEVSESETYSGDVDSIAGLELCAEFSVLMTDGTTCTGQACTYISSYEYGCSDSTLIDSTITCPQDYAPVCGCDGMTYQNQCEALFGAGVTSFYPGTCIDADSTCQAAFNYWPYVGTSGLENAVVFQNTSVGNQVSHWMLSDGSTYEANTDTFIHEFPEAGVYYVCLLIESADCTDAICQSIETEPGLINPDTQMNGLFDYVYPGDANSNGAANMDDLLMIGLGYDSEGPIRPNASHQWYGQPSFDWTTAVTSTNSKHIDTDGSGEIDYRDVDNIIINATPLPEGDILTDESLPKVELVFDVDTIFINNPGLVQTPVSAEIRLGSVQQPAIDLYGFNVAFEYESDLVVPHSIFLDYKDNSFFGTSNEVLWTKSEFENQGQLDVGFVRKNHTNKSGYGAIAKMDIIIGDVVTLRTGQNIPVVMNIKTVHGIDADGNIIDLAVTNNGMASVIFVDKTTTGITEPGLSDKIHISPNPVHNELTINCGEMKVQRIEILDIFGHSLYLQQTDQASNYTIPTEDLPTGQYILNLMTEKGIATKKFVKMN